jgi:hypothetical protein
LNIRARFAAREARAKDRVGVLLDEDSHDALKILRVVLEIRIVDDRDRTFRPRQRGANGLALAAVVFMAQEQPVYFAWLARLVPASPRAFVRTARGQVAVMPRQALGFGEGSQDRGRGIGRAVVDHDDLDPIQIGRRFQDLQSAEGGRDQILLVVGGHEHGKGSHGQAVYLERPPMESQIYLVGGRGCFVGAEGSLHQKQRRWRADFVDGARKILLCEGE